jgi:hypothetical protein
VSKGDLIVDIDLATLELGVQVNVPDAGDGAGAVGPGAARHDVDPTGHGRRNEMQIDAIALLGRYEAAVAVQPQRTAAGEGIQAAQVRDRRTGKKFAWSACQLKCSTAVR